MLGIFTWVRKNWSRPDKTEKELLQMQLEVAKKDRTAASSEREYYQALEALLLSRIARIEKELASPKLNQKQPEKRETRVLGSNKPTRSTRPKEVRNVSTYITP